MNPKIEKFEEFLRENNVFHCHFGASFIIEGKEMLKHEMLQSKIQRFLTSNKISYSNSDLGWVGDNSTDYIHVIYLTRL